MPKPVPLTHGFFSTMDISAYLPRPPGRRASVFFDLNPGQLVVSTTPSFHLMGLIAFAESLFHGIPFVLCPDQPISAGLIIDVIQATNPTAALLGPSMLADMVDSPKARETLRTLDAVYFGGAPLAPEVGDILETDTNVITLFGSSEMGLLNSFVPKGEKVWNYFEWSPEYGVKMEHQDDGLYELVIPRRPNSRRIHGIFHTFPHLGEYHSNDLFEQHPERPELWKYHGRKDDVLVLSNGEKLNPVTLEVTVAHCPGVKHALMIGQGRFETALLVEPTKPVEEEKAFVEAIWPTVEQANQTVPKYGRVSKNKIRVASAAKPFKVTPKGVLHRRTINNDYHEEIEAIYAAADDTAGAPPLPETLEFETLRDYVHNLLSEILERSDLTDDEDLYGAGLDSLQTIHLARKLHTAIAARLPDSTTTINQQQIYANPTLSRLAQYVTDVVQGRRQASILPRSERIAKMVKKYTSQLPRRCSLPIHFPDKSTVILTGSTGSLGTYLLHQLLTDSTIAKVYCFNRSDEAQSRQRAIFASKGLDPTLLDDPSRAEFLTVIVGARQFGLPDATYHKLLDSVNLIIHNAWKVNFNQPLESFEDPHLYGVLEFLWFSHRSAARAHLTFISSVSTIGEWDSATMGPVVPEAPVESSDAVMEQGYGESKYVGERLCWAAAHDAGIPTTVLRVGQIGGPTTREGMWNVDEWLPTLVKTSVAMGKVPADLGAYRIDWVPVVSFPPFIVSSKISMANGTNVKNILATIIVELAHTRQEEQQHTPHGVYHLVNPKQVKWESMMPVIKTKYDDVQSVALEEWLHELGAVQSPTEAEVRAKPALKLLDFYRGLTGNALSMEVSVERAQKASLTMAKLGPVTADLLANWLEQWKF
jgi:thioester reductase-like protein